jgi:hypothetical protein
VNSLFRSSGLVVRRCLWVAASLTFFCQGCIVGWVFLELPSATVVVGGE